MKKDYVILKCLMNDEYGNLTDKHMDVKLPLIPKIKKALLKAVDKQLKKERKGEFE